MTNSHSDAPIPGLAQEKNAVVDWLTVTVKDGDYRRELFELQTDMVAYHKGIGNKITPWKFKGYQGIQTQGFRWGSREDSDIVILSGIDANEFWPMALRLYQNVSRIDLAVTVLLRHPVPGFAQSVYETIKDFADTRSCRRRLSCFVNNHGGQTLYVGSRVSDQFGRLYDKGRENPKQLALDPGLLWRYETEFKGARAKSVATQLRRRLDGAQGVSLVIAQTVETWFFCRGVPLLDVTSDGDVLDLQVAARVTDDQATLDWLSNQVRPSVDRLRSNGKTIEAIQALGLGGFDKSGEGWYTGFAS